MKIKKYLRAFAFNLAALWLVGQSVEGVSLSGGVKTLLMAALALTLVNLLVRPLIKLLFLPINLLTLGAFRWLINVVALYLVTYIVPGFSIKGFLFAGYSNQGFIIPEMQMGTFWAYVVVSLMISLITTFIYWLIK